MEWWIKFHFLRMYYAHSIFIGLHLHLELVGVEILVVDFLLFLHHIFQMHVEKFDSCVSLYLDDSMLDI